MQASQTGFSKRNTENLWSGDCVIIAFLIEAKLKNAAMFLKTSRRMSEFTAAVSSKHADV